MKAFGYAIINGFGQGLGFTTAAILVLGIVSLLNGHHFDFQMH